MHTTREQKSHDLIRQHSSKICAVNHRDHLRHSLHCTEVKTKTSRSNMTRVRAGMQVFWFPALCFCCYRQIMGRVPKTSRLYFNSGSPLILQMICRFMISKRILNYQGYIEKHLSYKDLHPVLWGFRIGWPRFPGLPHSLRGYSMLLHLWKI